METVRCRTLASRGAQNPEEAARRALAVDVLTGLSERPRRLPSRWLYDAEGSRLFTRITGLDAYYLTRCEREILERHSAALCESVGSAPVNLVDLGAGDGQKTMLLLDALRARPTPLRYVPIDISAAALDELVRRTARRFPGLAIEGLITEWFDGLEWLGSTEPDRRNLVLFLGSSIGNLDGPRMRAFLRRLWNVLRPGDLVLLGFDLKKDIDILLRAYNDGEGVTREFNLNLLRRINRELEADFALGRFRHFGTFNVFTGAMESYLVSQQAQRVHIGALSCTFEFAPWEPLHVEYSYKFLDSDITALARETGYSVLARWYDHRRWFTDTLWRVEKEA